MSEPADTVARRLCETRQWLGLRADEVEPALGMNLGALESGLRAPSEQELRDLAAFYRHPVSWFFGDESALEDESLARSLDELSDDKRREVLRYAMLLRYCDTPPTPEEHHEHYR